MPANTTQSYQIRVPSQGSTVFSITGRNVVFRGEGPSKTLLVFDDMATYFQIGPGSVNVTLSGFAVDMARLPLTLGRVEAVNGSTTVLSVPDQDWYPTDARVLSRYYTKYLNVAQAVIGYVPDTERFQKPDIYALSAPFAVTYSNDSASSQPKMVIAKGGLASVGAWLVVRHHVYGLNAISLQKAAGVEVVDVVLFSCPGMGLVADQTTGITLTRFQTRRLRRSMTEAPSGGFAARAMSITADGVHISNSRGGAVRVQNCFFEGQGDDGMNINTEFARVNTISADRRTIFLTGHAGSKNSRKLFWIGARAEFFSGPSMVARGTSSAAVTAVSQDGVTFSDPLPEALVSEYDLVVNAEAAAESVRIEDSQFVNNRARGVLLKQGNARIARCLFSGQTSPAIITEIDGCFWMEGRPLANWEVVNSTIDGPNGFGAGYTVTVSGKVPKFINGKPSTTCLSVTDSDAFRNVTISSNTVRLRAGHSAEELNVNAATGVNLSYNSIYSDTS
eukprot:Hpha_TRINITY_DN9768_c0_g1::TRINITY_DN9768_c0_g1_i1::g.10103::m.10103